MTKLNQLPILSKSEYHYLIDTDEFNLHLHKDNDTRLARPDVPSFPGSKPTQVVSPIDYATLKVMQECLCVIKDCVQQIKESLVFIVEPDAWFSLIDAIECSHIDAPTTPANLAEGQLLLAEGITELLERVGCLDDEVPTPNAILDVNIYSDSMA